MGGEWGGVGRTRGGEVFIEVWWGGGILSDPEPVLSVILWLAELVPVGLGGGGERGKECQRGRQPPRSRLGGGGEVGEGTNEVGVPGGSSPLIDVGEERRPPSISPGCGLVAALQGTIQPDWQSR